MLEIIHVYAVIKNGFKYEVVYKHNENYFVAESDNDLTGVENATFKLKPLTKTKITDLSILLTKYVPIGKASSVKTGAGNVIITDDNTFLYYNNVVNVEAGKITVNFGNRQVPELEEIDVIDKVPLICIDTSIGSFEIYELKSNLDLIYTSAA